MNLVQRLQAARRASSDERGFTLIELLVSIVILGVLSAIVVFSTGGITNRGEASSLNSSARTIQTASEAYFAQCGEYAPTVAELVDPTPAICDKGPATAGSGDGYMQAPEGWTPSLGNGPWVPFTGATMSYVPGANPTLPPDVTWTGPNGTSGGGGGGATTTTTTTTTLPAGPCAFVSGAPTSVTLGSGDDLTADPTFTVVTSGSCTSGISIVFRKDPGNPGSTITVNLTGGPTTWTESVSQQNNNWDNGTSTVTVRHGAATLGTFTLTINNAPQPCEYDGNQETPDVNHPGTSTPGPLSGGPYIFEFDTTGTCTGSLTMNLSGSQPTIGAFVAVGTSGGVTTWRFTVSTTTYNTWVDQNNVQATIELNGTPIVNGNNVGQLDVD